MGIMISLKNITKVFTSKNNALEVLKNVNLDINKGEIFGIIGMSGAGKSTLLRCINLLERPNAGKIFLDGVELTSLCEKELRLQRRSMGMIFQQFNLLMQKTVIENVCFPLKIAGVKKREEIKRAKELLELVGLSDKIEAYPAQLSGGQKQRVAIARALATSPKVLLCDEATSALDPNTTSGVLALLKDINKRLGITIIVITHEMKVIREICNRVAIIDAGNIAEIGQVEDIFKNPKTKAGRELVFHEGQNQEAINDIGENCYRIVFEGESSEEPILSNMILECRDVVNILSGNTRTVDGKVYGQMMIQMPKDEKIREKMLQYLRERGVFAEEVKYV